MKKLFLCLFLFIYIKSFGQNQLVITKDIDNFWIAYDEIVRTKDSLQKIEIIQKKYIDKGTEGLKGIMEARQYTANDYVSAIEKYPLFWSSIRKNTLMANSCAKDIQNGIKRLKKIYPPLKPAQIYFTVGALRTNGTTLKDKVLIGSEIAMGNQRVNTSELGKRFSHLPPYFETNPLDNIVFLNVHEFVHTQQKTTIGNNLLAQTVLEGACEYLATLALKVNSPNPQIAFGKLNDNRIKEAFTQEMFSTNFENWLWNSTENPFKMRDLAYYVGYAICESYYNKAIDKKLAIKQMIELDYNMEDELIAFVEESKYFSDALSTYKQNFENARPFVTKIEPFMNGQNNIDTLVKSVTIYFSQPMRKNSADFDIGPLGNANTMWIKKRTGFSEDGTSYTIEIQPLISNKNYQLWVTDAFVNQNGLPLKPYLIDVSTEK